MDKGPKLTGTPLEVEISLIICINPMIRK